MQSFCLAPEHFDLVTVSGPDAARLLQGQLTCDVDVLGNGAATWGAACNIKGRVYATFLLLRSADTLQLVLARGTGPLLAAALQKFLPFYKCTLALNPEGWQCLGLAGTDAEQLLKEQLGSLPDALTSMVTEAGWICTLSTTTPQFLFCTSTAATGALTTLSATLPSGSWDQWQVLGLKAGHFPFTPDDAERYTPQELHLDRHGYVSFSKGCYTGQEIVARMHYRGKAKKQLYLLTASGADLDDLAPGFDVMDSNGTMLGHTLKQVTAIQEGAIYALAQLPVELAASGGELQTSSGTQLAARPF